MQSIQLCEGKYLYLSDYNLIINKEIKNKFSKYAFNIQKVHVYDVISAENKIKENIKDLKQITFEVTQNCNLRCKYCEYGDDYLYNRKRSEKELNFETAKKGIDYIFGIIKNRNKKDLAISFYGGEPLLNFNTLSKIVKYSKKKFSDWNIHFYMTTNGTLLNEKIIEFLSSNNFRILVSLDGPEEIHDAKRVFPNGRGTFKLIMNNLNKIKRKNKLYFEKFVSFSAVWSLDLSIQKIYDFFTTNKLVSKRKVMLNRVVELDTIYYDRYPYCEDKIREEYTNILKLIRNKIEKGKKLKTIEFYFYNSLLQQKLKVKNFTTLYGACFFNSRLFIDVDGKFHICHMINNRFSIGDVWNGFDFKKMVRIIEEFTHLTKTYCNNCEVRFLCQKCYVTFAKNGKFKIDKKFCEKRKRTIKNALENYIKLNEEKFLWNG